MNLDDFKLKHLHTLTSAHVDYMYLMTDIMDYKHNWFNKIFKFNREFKKMYSLIKLVHKLEPKKLIYEVDKVFKTPDNIDNISFIAMIELTMLFSNPEAGEMPVNELIAKAVSMACFSENVPGDFDTDSYSYDRFYRRVMEQPAHKMLALYNWIEKELEEAGIHWSKLFFNVEVIDKDYEQAGGNRMQAFNVVNTIKGICLDFNVTNKEAWQVQYAVTQTNSLSKATAADIQDKMSKIKESRMKAKQKAKN